MCLTVPLVFALESTQGAGQGLSVGEMMRGIGLAATLLAIVALVLVEFVYRTRLPQVTHRWLLLMGILVLPAVALTSTTTTVYEETKTVESCSSCHVMNPFVNDMMSPSSVSLAARHYKNKWISAQQCYSCHTTYGVHGTLAAKRDGLRHWLLYVTGTWNEPIQYSGTYPNSNCLACHVNTQEFEMVKSHVALTADLVSDRVSCVTCHGPPHPVPSERQSPRANR